MAELGALIDRAAALPPGPELSAALAALPWEKIPNARVVEVLQARSRQLSHEHAEYYAGMVEISHTVALDKLPEDLPGKRTEAVARAGSEFEWASHEIAAGLTLTPGKADRELAFGLALCERLPLVHAALLQGRIDLGKARVFVDYLDPANGEITEEQARRLCERFLPVAPGLTAKQLADRLYRALLAIDPGLRRRRYERAVQGRSVALYLDRTGTATLVGNGLPADEAAAAAERNDRLVDAAKRAGHPGTRGQISADIYLGMLNGTFYGLTEEEIIRWVLGHRRPEDDPNLDTPDTTDTATTDSAADASGTGDAGTGDPDAGIEAYGPEAENAGGEDIDTSDIDTSETGAAYGAAADAGSSVEGTGQDTRATAEVGSSTAVGAAIEVSSTAGPGCGPGPDTGEGAGEGEGEGAGENAGQDAGEDTGQFPEYGDVRPPAADAADDRGAADRRVGEQRADDWRAVDRRAGEQRADDRWSGDRWAGERVGIREGIEIRAGLGTLAGCDDRPGEIPGLGPVSAHVARTVATRQRRGARWLFAIVDPRGYLLLAGPLRRRPHTPGAQAPAVRGGIVEIHLSLDEIERYLADPALADWHGVLAEIARAWAGRDEVRKQLAANPRARFARGSLADHVCVRDRNCVGPGCTCPARRSDLDHTRDHGRGGETVEGNIGPACWRHHPDKQRGWSLSQPEPGLFRWLSPLGQVYWTRGEPIRPDLPDPHPDPDPNEESAAEVDQRLRRYQPRMLQRPATDPSRPPPPKPEPPPDDEPPPF